MRSGFSVSEFVGIIPILGEQSSGIPQISGASNMKLIAVDGSPGSGKTTLSELIAERYDVQKTTTVCFIAQPVKL